MVGDGTWLTVSEAARALGVDDQTVRRWADGGRLDTPHKVWRLSEGGHRRIHRDSTERLRRELHGES